MFLRLEPTMPARKAFFGRRSSTRTTSGCSVCRRRRLKCDEKKPDCQRCTKAGFRCEYGVSVKWSVGGAKPGNNRSRRPTITLLPRTQEFAIPNLNIVPRPLNIYPPMSDHDKTIFHFYTNQMCPQCRLRDGNNNLYRQIIIPIAFESDLLRRSVLAVGANRLNIQRTALHHEAAVLSALQGRLANTTTLAHYPDAGNRFPRVEVLAVVLLLCFYELDSPSYIGGNDVQPWRVHMRGAQHIIQHYFPSPNSQSQSLESGIISFLAQYFAARCTLTYSTTANLDGNNEMLNSARYWLGLIDRPTREINLFAGCSNELLALLLTITETAFPHETSERSYQSLRICEQMIENLHQDIPLTMQATSTRIQAEGIATTAEAFRLATLVILESTLPNRSVTMMATEPGVKGSAIASLFHLLTTRTTPLVSPCGTLGTCSYLWPYYILSCYIGSHDERDILRAKVEQLTKEWGGDSKERTRQQLVINHILRILENTCTGPPFDMPPGKTVRQVDSPVSNQGSIEWS